MKKLSKMTIKEILEETGLIMQAEEIVYFCKDADLIEKFAKLDRKKELNNKKIKQLLLDNESKIDKEKMVLTIIKIYIDNIKVLDRMVKDRIGNNANSFINTGEEGTKLLELEYEKHIQEEHLKKAIKLGRNIDKIVPVYYFDKKKGRYGIRVIDAKSFSKNSKSDKNKNLKRFKEIDNAFREKDIENAAGVEYILQSLVLTDFTEIFKDEQLGYDMRTLILDNEILREKIKTREQLEKLRIYDYDKYNKTIEKGDFKEMLPAIRNAVEEYVEYVDMEKLLVISAYRFEEGLEKGTIDPKNIPIVGEILKTILSQVKEKNKKYKLKLQIKKDETYEEKDITYSSEDIEKCLERFIKQSYLTKSKIGEIRENIDSNILKLADLDEEEISVIFNQKEFEEKAIISDENFEYVATKLGWKGNQILKKIKEKGGCSLELIQDFLTQKSLSSNHIFHLYMDGTIDLEQIEKLKEIVDLSENINPYELTQYYTNSIGEDYNEVRKEQYKRYLELYKVEFLNKTPENQNEYSNQLIEQMIENYDKKHKNEYIEELKEFYKEGILPLEVILEWNDEEVLKQFTTDLYKENKMDFNIIKDLVKKGNLKFEYIEELVWTEDVSYEERIKLLEQGWIPEEEIFKLFRSTLIREEDLLELSKKSIINKEKVQEIINETKLEDLEKNSSIVLEVDYRLQKIRPDDSIKPIENDKSDNKIKNKSPRLIINPNEREEFFRLLGAGKPDRVKITSDSPFYNYEFYVIPDESGIINKNSVIIAERIYEEKQENMRNKNKEMKFATDNATYFFKYKDLMVLSNYAKKDEVVKEKENVVFKVNHTLATDKKNGYWAAGVTYAIAKTMLSSDLKEYSKENQRKIVVEKLSQIYSRDELIKILDKGTEIDLGEHTCEIVEEEER